MHDQYLGVFPVIKWQHIPNILCKREVFYPAKFMFIYPVLYIFIDLLNDGDFRVCKSFGLILLF